MKTIDLFGKELVQLTSFNQLRLPNGQRRNGLHLWICYPHEDKYIFLQIIIDTTTDALWLQTIAPDGVIYLTREDYDITLPNALAFDKNEKAA